MTESANPQLGAIEDAVERFGLYALCTVGLNALYAAFPWVGVWIAPVLNPLAEWVCDKVFAFLRLTLDLKVISLVNAAHQATFNREVTKLRILARTVGVDTDEFRKERQSAKNAFAQFVRYNGA